MKVLFAGSFDPITLGHKDIIERLERCFSQVYVLVSQNRQKNYLLPLVKREASVKAVFALNKTVEVLAVADRLTVDVAADLGVKVLARGVRNARDYTYEETIARVNQRLQPGIETLFLSASPEWSSISSSVVKEFLTFQKDIAELVPDEALPYICGDR